MLRRLNELGLRFMGLRKIKPRLNQVVVYFESLYAAFLYVMQDHSIGHRGKWVSIAKVEPSKQKIQHTEKRLTKLIKTDDSQTPHLVDVEPSRLQTRPEVKQERRFSNHGESVLETAVSQIEATPVKSHIPPEKRGGMPRKIHQGSTSPNSGEKAVKVDADEDTNMSRPQILCYKQGRVWEIVVALPEELHDNPDLQVRQGDTPLRNQDDRWLLEQISEVEVSWEEENETKTLPPLKNFAVNGGILFKLNKNDEGRHVGGISTGSYLAIVPKEWERQGKAHVAPENTSITGYHAHYFDFSVDDSRKITFEVGKKSLTLWQAADFELVGEQIVDAAEKLGPLFGKEPPRIRAAKSLWANISKIVVGEEGQGKGRWRVSFSPDPEQREQRLPPELKARKGGWYFIRLYDQNEALVDSLDFRFVQTLQAVSVESKGTGAQASAVPPDNDGYGSVDVVFQHEGEFSLKPQADAKNWKISKESQRTIVEIPPDPACDLSTWNVEVGTRHPVRIDVEVPRIWWALESESKEPEAWKDRTVQLSRDDCSPTSEKAVWLRLPRAVKQVQVGFAGSLHEFSVSVQDRLLCVSLRDFEGDPARKQPGKTSFQVTSTLQGKRYEVDVGSLQCSIFCKLCDDFSTLSEEEFLDHVRENHLKNFYRKPNYQEMRSLVPLLPHKIYKCSHCADYVEETNTQDPTGTIYDHLKKNHPGAKRKLCIVDDPDEIRTSIGKYRDLPRFKICNICDKSFDASKTEKNSKFQHLIKSHFAEILHLKKLI